MLQPADKIVSKKIADEIDVPLESAAHVECDAEVRRAYFKNANKHRNCIDAQLKPEGKLAKGWHEIDPKKMCASCACYWHLSCARNFALGVVR